MAEEHGESKAKKELGIQSKGHIGLEIGIVIMIGVLIWSLIVPQQHREQRERVTRLARAKMKVLFHLEYTYLSVDTVYATDFAKLEQFARTADQMFVPDSVFAPLKNAYMRFEEYRPDVEPLSLKDFRAKYLDSLITNPFTGSPFLLELGSKAGRRTFHIKPSSNDDENKVIGAVIDGEILWDEKAEMAR